MPAPIRDQDWITSDRYAVDEHGCWIWLGGVCEDGYGKCGARAGQSLAHRAFYAIIKGPIPAGMEIDHLCKNRLCVNPTHLEAVTHRENIRRGDYRSNHRNGRKTHCLRGHEFTPENIYTYTPRGMKTRRKCRACNRANAAKRKAPKL